MAQYERINVVRVLSHRRKRRSQERGSPPSPETVRACSHKGLSEGAERSGPGQLAGLDSADGNAYPAKKRCCGCAEGLTPKALEPRTEICPSCVQPPAAWNPMRASGGPVGAVCARAALLLGPCSESYANPCLDRARERRAASTIALRDLPAPANTAPSRRRRALVRLGANTCRRL